MATGERGLIYTITNAGQTTCVIAGYPTLVITNSAGARLPFRYTRGGGQYATGKPAKQVVLRPAKSAFFVVAKYRCDLGYANASAVRRWRAVTASVRLPGRAGVRLVQVAYPRGAYSLAYCPSPGDSAGNTVSVSAIEARLHDLFPS